MTNDPVYRPPTAEDYQTGEWNWMDWRPGLPTLSLRYGDEATVVLGVTRVFKTPDKTEPPILLAHFVDAACRDRLLLCANFLRGVHTDELEALLADADALLHARQEVKQLANAAFYLKK
jgi:hypothetical protein